MISWKKNRRQADPDRAGCPCSHSNAVMGAVPNTAVSSFNPSSETEGGARAPSRPVFRALAENRAGEDVSRKPCDRPPSPSRTRGRVRPRPRACVLPNFGIRDQRSGLADFRSRGCPCEQVFMDISPPFFRLASCRLIPLPSVVVGGPVPPCVVVAWRACLPVPF
jgi:hypothetical protein